MRTAAQPRMIVVSVIIGMEAGQAYAVDVYPVPADAQLRVHLSLPEAECLDLRLMDMLGRTVLGQQLECLQDQDLSIDLRTIASGAYLLRVVGERGMLFAGWRSHIES
ncbi:MAG: T9SS type A sorting domain-containing protein [Bacteroidia bacterium]